MWPGHAVLLAAVPVLEGWVRARTAHHDPTFVADDPGFPHAHATVLAPFPRASVAGLLPAQTRVEELVLTWWESGACRVLGRFPLGVTP